MPAAMFAMLRIAGWIAGVCLLAALVGCWSRGAAEGSGRPRQRLTITGSSTLAPLIAEIARRFEQRRPEVRIEVQSGGTSRGIADVRSGLADLGMVSRSLLPEEADLHAFAVARDGIGILVHRDNPVGALTDAQIVAIFTGKVRQWRELGGPEAPITVVQKAQGRSTLELFCEHFRLAPRELWADTVIGDNQQGIKLVAGNPHAIGYVSIGSAETEQRLGTPVRLLPCGQVPATMQTVADGSFPLTRTLHLVAAKPPGGVAADFVAFARSEQVHDLIEEFSFVPVR